MSHLSLLSETEIQDIEAKANSKLSELHKPSRILGKDVFRIVKREAILLQSPLQEEDLCAFVCQKKGRLFVYINSQIPKEKQYFAAAHELYHIWFDKDYLAQPELLKSNTLNDETDNTRELRANLFAAMFLVPKHVLEQELLFLGIPKGTVSSSQVVELACTFQVPYKSMVRRLFEIGYIDRPLMKQLWEEPNVAIIRKKLQLDEPDLSQPIFHYEGLVERALSLYQEGHISPKRLRSLLTLLNREPKDFGISMPDDLPSEEEIENLLEGEDD
ncbi:ImmA/IrrE family metallo-endopeptidase [Ectobacillus funiculus]|uniref:ImmA/IrrE family metallo-endopeptidase n=1 Tax=Ectobacillus funiculus TaxID=137993 RepID=A0ABV5WPC4_9BACI